MTKSLSSGKLQLNNFNANEDFVMFIASKLITYFIDGFTLRIKSQSIAYLRSEMNILYILDFEP